MIRAATSDDVRRVGEAMWDRGQKELHALGVIPAHWVAAWMVRIRCGEAYAIGDDAIIGWDLEAPGVYVTSFQATRDFDKRGKEITKALRKAIPQWMRERKASRANVYSLCVEDSAPKWFRVLGFQEDMTYVGAKYGPYVMRLFVKES